MTEKDIKDQVQAAILQYVKETYGKREKTNGEKEHLEGEKEPTSAKGRSLALDILAKQVDAKGNETAVSGVLYETEEGVSFVKGREDAILPSYTILSVDLAWLKPDWWEDSNRHLPDGVDFFDVAIALVAEYLIIQAENEAYHGKELDSELVQVLLSRHAFFTRGEAYCFCAAQLESFIATHPQDTFAQRMRNLLFDLAEEHHCESAKE